MLKEILRLLGSISIGDNFSVDNKNLTKNEILNMNITSGYSR